MTRSRLLPYALWTVLLCSAAPLRGQVMAADSTLRAEMEALERVSPSFARGLDSLRAGRFPVHVVTSEEYAARAGERVRQPATVRLRYAPADPQRIDSAFVVVDLDHLRRAYAAAGRADALSRDLQLLLAHELYGHLAPAAASGRRRDACFDPGRFARLFSPDAKGCPTERENRVRAELGAPERPSYGSLVLEAGEAWEVIGRAYRRLPERVPSVTLSRGSLRLHLSGAGS